MAVLREPLIALFLVAALGYLVGRVRIGRFSLGVAAVLFVGLAVSGADPSITLPELVPQMGLALFIYSVGLSSGPGFFASFGARGLRDAGYTVAVLGVGAGVAAAVGAALGLPGRTIAGLFCGALTNTPALAAVVNTLERSAHPAQAADPVVAYSVAYPLGVLGVLGAIVLVERLFRLDLATDRPSHAPGGAIGQHLESATVRITRPGALGKAAAPLREALRLEVLFGRRRHGDVVEVVADDTVFAADDLVTVVGTHDEVRRAVSALGEESKERLELDRRVLDFRRVFVSSAKVVGVPLGQLGLVQRFGATVTRLRRGDVEILPDSDTTLELGDRVRVIAPRARIDEVSKYFGDSYQSLAEIDVLTFGLGVVLGLLVGHVGVPLPGGASFRLGVAGGPLLVGLLLGRLGRTGPLIWTMPYSASLTLRQLGLVLFLGGVGLRSGGAFVRTMSSPSGLWLLGAGALVTLTTALSALIVGRKLLRIPLAVLVGTVAGIHTQPAVLAFGTERTGNDLPRLGYASSFPIATVVKILFAQGLFLVLS